MRFDLLIRNGHVLDPASGVDGRLDVAIRAGRVAAVEAGIAPDAAFRTIDADGHYVLPGLVDLHAHVYTPFTFVGVDADAIGRKTGVTTWVDAGSAGALTFAGLRDCVIRPALMRIYAFLNISNIGLVGLNWELANIEYCDLDHFRAVANANRDLIRGVKVRMGAGTVGNNGLEPLRRARRAADECELPLMVHIAYAPPTIADVLELMRPGDILTHSFTGVTMKIVDDDGALLDVARRAWDSGVIFDIGHGAGSFSFETAAALAEVGRWPDVISTDLHRMSIGGPDAIHTSSQGTPVPDFDGEPPLRMHLPLCMSKFLALGMPLGEVVRAATEAPARAVGLEGVAGTLRPGARADVAVFALDEGRFRFHDLYGNEREGAQQLRNVATILGGRPLELPDEDRRALDQVPAVRMEVTT
jgi:dihydroorotase